VSFFHIRSKQAESISLPLQQQQQQQQAGNADNDHSTTTPAVAAVTATMLSVRHHCRRGEEEEATVELRGSTDDSRSHCRVSWATAKTGRQQQHQGGAGSSSSVAFIAVAVPQYNYFFRSTTYFITTMTSWGCCIYDLFGSSCLPRKRQFRYKLDASQGRGCSMKAWRSPRGIVGHEMELLRRPMGRAIQYTCSVTPLALG
jgi:hypothetical protein